MDPLERSREFTKQSMEPWKEEFIPSRKIRILVPIKLPSMNDIQASAFGRKSIQANMAKKKKDVKLWKDEVERAVRSQIPSETVRYFTDRLGMEGIYYRTTITARLFRLYDEDNYFDKYTIDALKKFLIKDDSPKYIIGKVDVVPEIIPYAKRVSVPNFGRGKKKTITKYYNDTGKQLYPETIIEIEMVERQEVLL